MTVLIKVPKKIPLADHECRIVLNDHHLHTLLQARVIFNEVDARVGLKIWTKTIFHHFLQCKNKSVLKDSNNYYFWSTLLVYADEIYIIMDVQPYVCILYNKRLE